MVLCCSNLTLGSAMVHNYSPALKKWGLHWICLVLSVILSLCHSVIQSFHNLSNEKNSSHFSKELWGLEDWNLVHTWTVGRCIVYTGIGLLLLICPVILNFFFLFNFQTLKFFVILFSGTWGLEGWNMVHTWTMGDVLCIQKSCCCFYSSLYFSFFLLSNFQTTLLMRFAT